MELIAQTHAYWHCHLRFNINTLDVFFLEKKINKLVRTKNKKFQGRELYHQTKLGLLQQFFHNITLKMWIVDNTRLVYFIHI